MASSTIWVLILFLSGTGGGGVAVTSTEFLSQAACENGLAAIKQQARQHTLEIGLVGGVCVPKGQP